MISQTEEVTVTDCGPTDQHIARNTNTVKH